MLSAANRLTRSADFGLTVRRGRRAGRSRLVVHLLRPQAPECSAPAAHDGWPTRGGSTPPRVGFVVSKSVGVAVVRHRVSRRLRHLFRDLAPRLPGGTLVVVRALPSAAQASSRELGADLMSALTKLRALDSTEEQHTTDHQ
ncbi:ribonuclease P protein component [Allosaccharopolyspora coralli]|uniref:Ribonuclease P protein component n=1 Tax=Allosaccharopolyspora coralli TaxID=2665642 RepID=A0A5Q3QBS1_9PSEU|nr:ribonuclease P protein component [Allosaccharopolyspora coralli]QGK71912.1 ribonuclease P protein component [Allosaccharopolyspora coralli]